MKKNSCLIESFDDLPKWIGYDTGKDILCFHPIIFKWENVGISNAYFAMYARYYTRSCQINPTQALFFVHESSYDKAVFAFIEKYNQMRWLINGKGLWTGERPLIIDLMDHKAIDELRQRNVNMPKKDWI